MKEKKEKKSLSLFFLFCFLLSSVALSFFFLPRSLGGEKKKTTIGSACRAFLALACSR